MLLVFKSIFARIYRDFLSSEELQVIEIRRVGCDKYWRIICTKELDLDLDKVFTRKLKSLVFFTGRLSFQHPTLYRRANCGSRYLFGAAEETGLWWRDLCWLRFWWKGRMSGEVVLYRCTTSTSLVLSPWVLTDLFRRFSQYCEKRLLASLRPSVRPYVRPAVSPYIRMEQLGSQFTDFHEIWYSSIFRKSV